MIGKFSTLVMSSFEARWEMCDSSRGISTGKSYETPVHSTVMEPSFDLLQPPRTFLRAYMYEKAPAAQATLLALGFLALATKGVEGADHAASNACDCSSRMNVASIVDGVLALILAFMWGLRTYFLSQSYDFNQAPYWARLRNRSFWMSVFFIVVATGAIVLGWSIPNWRTTMQNVVAVVVGALAVATAERRAQGPASARLKALQHMLRRPYYRDGRTGDTGYSNDLGRRLFQERDILPGKLLKIGGWDCKTVEATKAGVQHWEYYVKAGPINDHFFMGRYQVLEAAGSGHDPLAFAAAYASVSAAYMLRPKLKRVMVRISSFIVKSSGRVRSSLGSWRPGALALLLGIDKLDLPDISKQDDWPTSLHDTKSIVVLWAVFWLEDAFKMEA